MSVSVRAAIKLWYPWVNDTSFILGKLSWIRVEKNRSIILKDQKLQVKVYLWYPVLTTGLIITFIFWGGVGSLRYFNYLHYTYGFNHEGRDI